MSKIKLKETKKDIKVLDKTGDVSAHMKNAFIRSKDGTEKAGSKCYTNYRKLERGFSRLLGQDRCRPLQSARSRYNI